MNFFASESYAFLILTLILIISLVIGIFLISWSWKKYRWVSVLSAIGALFLSWGLFVEPYRLVVNEFEISNKNLPIMRLAVVSDLHLRMGKSENWVKKVVQKISQQEFDVLVIPGDFLTSSAEKYADKFSAFEDIKQPIFFVTGNHDYRLNGIISENRVNTLRKNLLENGLVELKNSAIEITPNVFLLGVSDNYLGFDEISAAYKNVPKSSGKILLAHSPDIIDEFESGNSPELIIAGHTHCGQIRFPFLGAVPGVIPTDHGKEFDKHFYEDKNLFVSCGVGESGPAFRFWNPPEINILKVN